MQLGDKSGGSGEEGSNVGIITLMDTNQGTAWRSIGHIITILCTKKPKLLQIIKRTA